MRPVGLTLYRLATGLLEFLAPHLLHRRARRGKEDMGRLPERLGHASVARPEGQLVWLHGASVGESLSLLPLIDALSAAAPKMALLVTSGTVTSAELMTQRLPGGVIHQFVPIDTPGAARRFLRYWKPSVSVFVESEIWPNLILSARAEGSRLALFSARMSTNSLRRWGRMPKSAHFIFGAFDQVMAQDDTTASALAQLGAQDNGRLNLKRLGGPPPVDAMALDALLESARGKSVLLAASTHPGEDELVLQAFRSINQPAALVITPRHPARAMDIRAAAEAADFSAGLRSQGASFGDADVYIADTLGEMGLWFSLADAAFIGGSLLPGPGGHNPVEAAELNCPIITGPYLDNWREIYADLHAADGVMLAENAETLAAAFTEMLQNPAGAAARVSCARKVLTRDGGALQSAVDGLISLVP